MKVKNYLLSSLVGLTAMAASAQTVTTSYNYTGGIQTFTVPCGVDTLFVQAWGAQGGNGDLGGGPSNGGGGGLGGYAEGWLLVTPGETINIFVGGQGATPTGGFNGGGNGGTQNAGGGGGSSDVRQGGTADANRVITAGGGGGGGRGGCHEGTGIGGDGGDGGAGGGGIGVNGQDSPQSSGVAGGGFGGNFGSVQGGSGGAGFGCSGFLGSPGSSASTSAGANGGAGQTCCCNTTNSIPGGGGGGGGQIGGGGGGGGSAGTTGCSGNSKGGGGGGGGGSSYTGGVLNGVVNNGIWMGNGMVSISYEDPTPDTAMITASTMNLCASAQDTITLMTPSDPEADFYTWTVDAGLVFISGQNTNTIMVTSMNAGTFTIMANATDSACGLTGGTDTITVSVWAIPTVTYSEPMDTVCAQDGPFALSGNAPTGGTFSGAAVSGGNFDPSMATSGSNNGVTYTYVDTNGCWNMATDSIWVDMCMGLTTQQLNAVKISPNPATNLLNVSWNNKVQVEVIRIMDVTGRVVLTETVNNISVMQINISALPAGTYTLSAEGPAGKSTSSFVKE